MRKVFIVIISLCIFYINPAHATLLVNSWNRGAVVFNETTGQYLSRVGIGGDWGIISGPDGMIYQEINWASHYGVNRFFVYADGSISDFEQFIDNPPFNWPIRDLDFGPDGNLYVSQFVHWPGGIPDPLNGIYRFSGITGEYIDKFASVDTPVSFVFGLDNYLYVNDRESGVGSDILRFDGTTGAFVDVFIPKGSGGLSGMNTPYPAMHDLIFGPDGNLYISAAMGVLRYDGTTGEFIDNFIPNNSGEFHHFLGGIDFGFDGKLYVAQGEPGPKRISIYDGGTGNFIDSFTDLELTNASETRFMTIVSSQNPPGPGPDPIPEPTTMFLLGSGLLGLVGFRRKFNKN